MRREFIQDGAGYRDLLYVDTAQLRAVADECQRLQREGITGTREMRHLAEIPAALVEKYVNDAGITFHEFINNPVHHRRMLNDPALAHFRVDPRKVGRATE